MTLSGSRDLINFGIFELPVGGFPIDSDLGLAIASTYLTLYIRESPDDTGLVIFDFQHIEIPNAGGYPRLAARLCSEF